MALYKSTFEKLVEVLTCQRCKKLFSEPVVLWCTDNICVACARDMSKEKESDIKGWYPCPRCLEEVPLRVDDCDECYAYNRQLGKAALVTHVMKELISVVCSTARRLTSDRDSGVGNEDGRSEASFVTGHSLASMEPPPNLAPGGALLHDLERYKPLFEKLVNVLTCPRCKNLLSDPVIMDCGHSICSSCTADSVFKEGGIWCDCPVCGEKDLERCSNTQLGKAALVVNVINKVMAWWYNTVRRVTSDRDSGVGTEDGRSKASFVTGVSWASMEPPPNMAAGGALFYHFTVELYKWAFQELVNVLTCRRCNDVFTEPVIMDCGHNICSSCAADSVSKEGRGRCHCPECGDTDIWSKVNTQLGKAALVVNVINKVIAWWYNTVRRVTSDRDSGVGGEDGRSKASFVTGLSWASMEPPPNMSAGGAHFTVELYKWAFQEVVNVLTCQRCNDVFTDPVIMKCCGHSICSLYCAADSVSKEGGGWCDCPVCGKKDLERCSNTQLGKAALVVNVINKVIAWWYNTVRRVTSDRDSGVGTEDGRSMASFVTGVSWCSMEPPPNMAAGGALFYHFTVELYKWAFQELVNLLTCQRCNDVFTDPVIMYCGHNICFVCAVDIELEAKEEWYPCPLCADLQIHDYYFSNSELGEAALIANEMKAVISGGSTARRVPSDPDSGVRRADARSEACFVTAYSWASMELPPNMAQGGALLYQFSTGLYKLALQEVGDVLTCPQCKKLLINPVVMDCGHNLCLACAADTPSKHEGGTQCPVCGCKQTAFYSNHQLSKAALLANVTKEVISLVTSDQDSGIRSEDARSEASFVSGHSQAGMDHPPNMLPDGAGVPDGLNNVKHNQILSWVTSAGSMEPPNRALNKGFTNKPSFFPSSVGSSYCVASPGFISSPEPPPSMAPGTELEMSSIPDVGDQGGSEGQEEHIGTASNSCVTSRAHRFHPYPARPDRTKSSSLHALWELMTDSRIDGGFVEDVIVACQGVLGNSTSIQAPEHPDPTNTAVRDLK